jgi:hypothetical protein
MLSDIIVLSDNMLPDYVIWSADNNMLSDNVLSDNTTLSADNRFKITSCYQKITCYKWHVIW